MGVSVKNRAGATFLRTVKRIDRLHKKIDRRARNGKYNEDYTPRFRLTKEGERVWSF